MNRCVSIPATFLALSLIIFTSGCTEGGPNLSIFGLDIGPGDPVYTRTENLKIEVEATPSEIYEGQSTTLFFDITNTGNTTISQGTTFDWIPTIDVILIDYEDFTTSENRKKIFNDLSPGETENWNWKLNSKEDIYGEKDSMVRYLLKYRSSSSSMYDIAVMSEDEYTRLEREGKLDEEINLFYYKTKSPVEIDLSVSKEQPILDGMEFYLYVKLKNMGGGSIDNIDIFGPFSLNISYPDFLEYAPSCTDFQLEDGKLVLIRTLKFYNKETKNIVCKFKVNDVNIRNIGQFKVNANYIYDYYKTINIKVKPK